MKATECSYHRGPSPPAESFCHQCGQPSATNLPDDGPLPDAVAGSKQTEAMVLAAELEHRRRLARTWRITDAGGTYELKYDGYGLGFETVSVDDVELARRSGFSSMSQRYVITFGDHRLSLSVVVARSTYVVPWGGLTFVELEIDGHVVYREGKPPQRPLPVVTGQKRGTIPLWRRPFRRRGHKIATITCLIALTVLAAAFLIASRWTVAYEFSTWAIGLWEGGFGINRVDKAIDGLQEGLVIDDAVSQPCWLPIVNRSGELIILTESTTWVGVTCNFVPIWCIMLVPAFCIAGVFWMAPKYARGFCQRCGYDLTGNVSGVCSECGLPK